MSDAYEIGGVKITPTGGGYYELTHPTLSEPKRVRGKEAADAEAATMNAAAQKGEGAMEAQGDLNQSHIVDSSLAGGRGDQEDGDKRTAAEKVQENTAGITPAPPPAPPAPKPTAVEEKDAKQSAKLQEKLDAKEEENAALKGSLKEMNDRFDRLEKLMTPVTTVIADAKPDEPEIQIGQIPQSFAGEMDAKTKAALKKIGVSTTKIVLEESESIPPTGLFVGHNGRSYMIVPGEEVDVPDFLLGVLDDAIMSAPQVDSGTKKVLGYRNRSRYPYRRVT